MSKSMLALMGLTASLILGGAACAQAPAPDSTPNDYAKSETWLCRPGRQDACAADQTTTVVTADGKATIEPFTPAADPPVDCFYVYPTVSTDPGGNSDMGVDPAERSVVEQQLARFAGQCRIYAPMYRQVTLAALRKVMMGQASPGDEALAYGDVRDAWLSYLAHDNKGRGVVLIGHSQGSRVLLRLIPDQIDGKPVQKQVISALILGMNTPVDAQGRFGTLPLCATADQVGCVVTYVSFRASAPPPAGSRFGRTDDKGLRAGCVNPAALLAGKASTETAPLHAYFSNRAMGSSALEPKPWATGLTVTTPFVSAPGLISGRCVSEGDFTYMSVSVNGDPADPRTDDITGDIMVLGQPLKDWGLHLIDVNEQMGDLVALVGRQSKTYLAKPSSPAP
ncbi:MAG: DUF3089 domain-containing protein [Alphaproteobacteria bacterium]|nr:DUF3089 domain-containing protein [Alphaproteobacteria bacterium]